MTPEQENQMCVRIAEAVGWKFYPKRKSELNTAWFGEYWLTPEGAVSYRLPHWLTSLDAIQAAALSMPEEFQWEFEKHWHWRMTAADWCVAFCATLDALAKDGK